MGLQQVFLACACLRGSPNLHKFAVLTQVISAAAALAFGVDGFKTCLLAHRPSFKMLLNGLKMPVLARLSCCAQAVAAAYFRGMIYAAMI